MLSKVAFNRMKYAKQSYVPKVSRVFGSGIIRDRHASSRARTWSVPIWPAHLSVDVGSPATPIAAAPKVPSGRELTELNRTSHQVATPLAYATRNLITSMRNCTSQHAQQPPSILRCQMHP